MLKVRELSEPTSCLNKALLGEMIFVLIQSDVAAPETIRFWVQRRIDRFDYVIQEKIMKPGDIVAYRTKDFYGYQYIFATVEYIDKHGAHLTTLCTESGTSGTSLLIPPHVLTVIKTVWQDSMKEVKENSH